MPNLEKAKKKDQLPSIADFNSNEVVWAGQKLQNIEIFDNRLQTYLSHLKYPTIRNIKRNDLIDLVFVVVSNNLRAMGSKMHHNDQILLVNDFVEELNDFKNITIKEFELIVKNGIRKKYDTDKIQTVGLTIANFNYWYRKYSEQKAKMDNEIANKLSREKSNNTQPRKITFADIEALLYGYYSASIERLSKMDTELKENYSDEQFWLDTGLNLSANYVFDQLVKFGELSEEDLIKAVGELNIKIDNKEISEFVTLADFKPSSKEYEAKRYLCCKFYLDLINSRNEANKK